MNDALDQRTKELAGIAAVIAGHCQPCFSYHYKEALRLKVSATEIAAAVEIARAVRGSGDRHMDEYAARLMSAEVVEPSAKGESNVAR